LDKFRIHGVQATCSGQSCKLNLSYCADGIRLSAWKVGAGATEIAAESAPQARKSFALKFMLFRRAMKTPPRWAGFRGNGKA
jgi:hypothetical protein